eukprot:gb/GECG01005769.1/.p1 GENE.gb/GECG01005769.1/~~gb/GECG01005769.1/.p1  ORF type:complete len:624 (+),score=34.21 gb/GECG01005769.1/:1-1872(+)
MVFFRDIFPYFTLFSLLSLVGSTSTLAYGLRGGDGPTLKASPAVIPNRRKPSNWTAQVTLSWDGAQRGHFIGFYYTLDALYPFGVIPIETTRGHARVEAYNFRQPFVYKILQRADPTEYGVTNQKLRKVICSSDEPPEGCEKDDADFLSVWRIQAGNVLAVSNTVRFEDEDAPQQLRLAIGNSPKEMRVMWTSAKSGGTPKVRVGTSPDMLDASVFSGTTGTYTINDMCNASGIGPANYTSPATDPANYIDPGIQNDVLLTGLTESARYYYQVSNGHANSDWGAVEAFITAPEVGTDKTVQSTVFGDSGVTLPLTTVVPGHHLNWSNFAPAGISKEFLLKSTADLKNPLNIIHIGDISYAVGYAVFWEYFMSRQIGTIAARIPYMVGIGNHEYDWPTQPFRPSWSSYGRDSGGECGVPYFQRFHMPGPGNSTVRSLYYSFDWGPIHYLVMSTETDFMPGSSQYKWIVNDLASVNRTKQPWLVFMGHRPMYTSSNHSFSLPMDYHFRTVYDPLMRIYHVDLALWGHVHQYERTAPMAHGSEAPAGHGTVHVVIGNAGNTYQMPWANVTANSYPVPSWIVFRTHDFGIGGITANKTHLSFAMHDDNRFLVHDKFALYSKDQAFRK